jgi:ribosomal-protein-alanine N-acetyltransferase
MTSPGVRKYLWDDEVIDRTQIQWILETSTDSFARLDYGLWAVLTDDNQFIGFCGFWHFHDPPQLELLYGIREDHWNRGLATEAATTMILHGFGELAFERIVASTDFANTASSKVMQKLGMKLWKRELTNGLDTIYFALERNEWDQRR